MTRDEYNKKVQSIQEFWPENAMRTIQVGNEVRFELYFDNWHTIGVQKFPFQPHSEYKWNEFEEIKIMSRFTLGLTSDKFKHNAS